MNNIGFGDYCYIEQKRYGAENEIYKYKVIGVLISNNHREVPVDSRKPNNVQADRMEDVVTVIQCGVCEERVERFRIKDLHSVESNIGRIKKLEDTLECIEDLMNHKNALSSLDDSVIELCKVRND